MRHRRSLPLFLSVCLLLCACTQQQSSLPSHPSDNKQQEETVLPSAPPPSSIPEQTSPVPNPLEQLTVELVLEWEQADTLLSQLHDLEYELQSALEEIGCPVDQITLTISTAGGFTAQSLMQGGIDAAILPALDFISCETEVTPIAMSSEDICEHIVAVSNANNHLDNAFHEAFFRALTESSTGQKFLSVCCPDVTFSAVSEEALKIVRDTLAEHEQTGGERE
ncbi:MAG: hypothetical protein IKC03_03385 [Oscillospiraceae bacterium]|nr:hypothetical protein [Oscillospiraceae bacterium]